MTPKHLRKLAVPRTRNSAELLDFQRSYLRQFEAGLVNKKLPKIYKFLLLLLRELKYNYSKTKKKNQEILILAQLGPRKKMFKKNCRKRTPFEGTDIAKQLKLTSKPLLHICISLSFINEQLEKKLSFN